MINTESSADQYRPVISRSTRPRCVVTQDDCGELPMQLSTHKTCTTVSRHIYLSTVKLPCPFSLHPTVTSLLLHTLISSTSLIFPFLPAKWFVTKLTFSKSTAPQRNCLVSMLPKSNQTLKTVISPYHWKLELKKKQTCVPYLFCSLLCKVNKVFWFLKIHMECYSKTKHAFYLILLMFAF